METTTNQFADLRRKLILGTKGSGKNNVSALIRSARSTSVSACEGERPAREQVSASVSAAERSGEHLPVSARSIGERPAEHPPISARGAHRSPSNRGERQ